MITIKEIHVKTTIERNSNSQRQIDDALVRKITNELYQKLKNDLLIESKIKKGR